MTVYEIYEDVLIELNKVKAPSLSVSDFLYFLNKATQQYVNEMYNSYEVNQQRVDDLRSLRSTVKLDLEECKDQTGENFYQCVYDALLPEDYFHILNCVVQFNVKKHTKCQTTESSEYIGVKRLTSDANPQVISNYYLRPSYKNPYYYINEIDIESESKSGDIFHQKNRKAIDRTYKLYKVTIATTNPSFNDTLKFVCEDSSNDKSLSFKELKQHQIAKVYRELLKLKNNDPKFQALKVNIVDSNTIEVAIPGLTKINSENDFFKITDAGNVNFQNEKEAYVRYGNSKRSRIEIRFGKTKDDAIPQYLFVDYLKVPQRISLTTDQLDDIEDNSQMLEFPDYVVYEIINRMTKLILENVGNPRVQLNTAVNQTIPTEPVASK